MKIISIRNTLFFFGIATVCLLATPASACSCLTPETAKAQLKISDAVFVGKVVEIGRKKFSTKAKLDLGGGKSKMITVSEMYYKLKITVSQSWKGAPKRTRYVFSEIGTSCQQEFFKGTTYLIYAYNFRDPRWKSKKGLYTHMCTRTAQASKAKKDLAELGKGKAPARYSP